MLEIPDDIKGSGFLVRNLVRNSEKNYLGNFERNFRRNFDKNLFISENNLLVDPRENKREISVGTPMTFKTNGKNYGDIKRNSLEKKTLAGVSQNSQEKLFKTYSRKPLK